MAANPKMTLEEVYDNYQYKVTKRMILREFPWVDDVTIDEETLNTYSLIFIDLTFNPYNLQKITGWPFVWYAKSNLDKEKYRTPFLSVLYDTPHEESTKLQRSIEELINSVKDSPAIPKEMKLPGNRALASGTFYAAGNPPEGYTPIFSPYIPKT